MRQIILPLLKLFLKHLLTGVPPLSELQTTAAGEDRSSLKAEGAGGQRLASSAGSGCRRTNSVKFWRKCCSKGILFYFIATFLLILIGFCYIMWMCLLMKFSWELGFFIFMWLVMVLRTPHPAIYFFSSFLFLLFYFLHFQIFDVAIFLIFFNFFLSFPILMYSSLFNFFLKK